MVQKYLLFGLVVVGLLIFSSAGVLGLTGSIGNSRMVLYPEVGEVIEKSILVKNVNDEPVTIDISASGELAGNIEGREESFEPEPLSEKKAYFIITVKEPGMTETKINVKFSPEDGSGVGLSSTVVVIASGEGSEPIEDPEGEVVDIEDSGSWRDLLPGRDSEDNEGFEKLALSPIVMFLASTGILIVLFVLLMAYYVKTGKDGRRKVKRSGGKNKVGRQSE